jgi:hypothetical protein
MGKYPGLRELNVQLFLTKDGKLEKVEALPGEEYEILNGGTATDIRDICTKERAILTDTAIVLVTQENPTCLRWKVRRTEAGWDVICVKWHDG